MKFCFLALLFCLIGQSTSAQPTITSFTPTSGPVGTTVTITGTNFDATPTNNIVFFGAVRANVSAASATSLTVAVPIGATYQTITATVNNLTASSVQPFTPTFVSGATLTPSSFATKLDFTTGTNPEWISIGDMDGDGKSDLVVVNSSSNSISLFRNTGSSGLVSFASKTDYPTANHPVGLSIGDIDGDGKLDIAVVNYNSNSISIFRNTSTVGAISFTPKTDFTTGTGPWGVTIGDIDGDGMQDIAVANYDGNTISIFKNLGTVGTISFASKVDFTAGAGANSVFLGDLDGDSKPDLTIANYTAGTISILKNTGTTGTISFAAKVDYATGNNPWNALLGDFDGDGKQDVAVTNANSSTVSVLRNLCIPGTISFAAKSDYVAGPSFSISVADVNGDANPDIIVLSSNSNMVSVLRNTSSSGAISFDTKINYTVGSNPYSVAVGDVDGDEKPDIVTANFASNTISVLRNKVTVPHITSFSPVSGPVGTTVTITGTNFDANPANNIVFFGAVRANVSAASTTSLTVTVPVGTTYQPITVTINSLTAYSSQYFTITFGSGVSFSANSFAAKIDSSTGTYPRGISTTDLNGDGKPDIVVANVIANTISILKNTGSAGIISFAGKVDYIAGNGPNHICIGDLDGDGKPDIVVTNLNAGNASTLSVFRNISSAGNILLTPKVDYPTGNGSVAASISDFDGDGKPDIVVTSGNSGIISVFRNTTASIGNISFASKIDYPFLNHPEDVFTGDLDQDGKADIVITNYVSNNISVLKNTTASVGNITFAPAINYSVGGSPDYISGGDFDADGKIDLAIENYSSKTLSILRNISSGASISFETSINYSLPDNPVNLDIGDLDGDGKLDIIVGNSVTGIISVFKNTTTSIGNISFATNIDYTTGNYSTYATLGDFDNDGKPDIAVVNSLFNNVSILRNKIYEPIIISFTPSTGITGTIVTIQGTNFTGATNVSFAGISALSFTVVNATTITAIVPTAASGKVSVTNPYGTGTLDGFNIIPPPTITSFSPLSGPVGTTVIITGTNFDATPANNIVFFGAVRGNIAAASETSLTVTVPVGATYQPFTVTKNGLICYSNQVFNVTFTAERLFTTNSFAPKVDYTTANKPINIVAGDFDGDGSSDVAVANNNSGSVSVFRNTSANGAVAFAQKTDYTISGSPQSVTIGDVDGDGKLDLVVTSSYPHTVSIFRNTSTNGNISFAAKIEYNTVTEPSDLVITDIDGDGKTDLAVAVTNSSFISVFRNTGTIGNISFAGNLDFSTGSLLPQTIAAGDLDGDGKKDLVASDYTSIYDSVSIFRNTSTPGIISFAPKIDYPKSRAALGISIADLDGDGKLDIATACWASNKISTFRNISNTIGTISFAPKVDFITGSFPESISIADLNGDGKPDIGVGNYISNNISLFRNTSSNGAISFAPKVDYPVGTNPKGLIMVDLDSDGKPDLASANINSNTISTLRNILPIAVQLCPGGSATVVSNIAGANYQWQLSTDSINFNNIADNSNYLGTNTNTLQLINIPSSWYGYQYRCIVNGINSDMFFLQFINTWNPVNTSWGDPANWSCGTLPDANTDVIINSGTVIVSSSTTIRSLTIAPTGNLIINPGVTLTILH